MHTCPTTNACSRTRDEDVRLRPATRLVAWLLVIASLVFLALPTGAHAATGVMIG